MALKNNCGKLNRHVNNVVHRTNAMEFMYGGCPMNGEDSDDPYEVRNYRNIYLLDDMEGFQFGRDTDRFYNLPPDFHDNIYWSLVAGDEERGKFPDRLNWSEWQATGNDSNSLWQDPFFEDPGAHIYVLSEESPAWDLGIEQVDLDSIGIQVYGKYVRNN